MSQHRQNKLLNLLFFIFCSLPLFCKGQSFELKSIKFTKLEFRISDTVFSMPVKPTPTGWKELKSNELRSEMSFMKAYFSIDETIPKNTLLRDQNFYDQLLGSCDFGSDSKRKFKIRKEYLKGYGECYIASKLTGFSTSEQNMTFIIVNNSHKQVSIWNYDAFRVDKNGALIVAFRLKDRNTEYYYLYDQQSRFFIPYFVRDNKIDEY